MKNLVVLGSTGSIGRQTLDVVRDTECANIVGITGYSNLDLLEEQALEFKPLWVCVGDEKSASILEKDLKEKGLICDIYFGLDGLISIVKEKKVDIVLNSLVGNIGLTPTVCAIENGKDIALANKETLVTGGKLVMDLAKKHGVNIYPVDSEHSAIYQCLRGNEMNNIEKIHLTASGGPFREKDLVYLKNVTAEQALAHPNWSMGNKITIDSATLMNKGLEVIEAKWLFDVELDKINVLVHPQSIIHSMVEFEDGAIMAQLGEPDMKVPIAYALTYPNRVKTNWKRINFLERNNLTFEPPKRELFPCLDLAFSAIRIGGTMPTVLNAANEVAVDKFLNGKISFLDIYKLIEWTMSAYTSIDDYSIGDVLQADKWAREKASLWTTKLP